MRGEDPVAAFVSRLREWRDAMDVAYGPCAEDKKDMEVGGAGTLAELLAFCRA